MADSTVKSSLWLFCGGFQDLQRHFWWLWTCKECNRCNILPVGLSGSTLYKNLIIAFLNRMPFPYISSAEEGFSNETETFSFYKFFKFFSQWQLSFYRFIYREFCMCLSTKAFRTSFSCFSHYKVLITSQEFNISPSNSQTNFLGAIAIIVNHFATLNINVQLLC